MVIEEIADLETAKELVYRDGLGFPPNLDLVEEAELKTIGIFEVEQCMARNDEGNTVGLRQSLEP
jgi:hypothetical protein